jgi:hypothetical protein
MPEHKDCNHMYITPGIFKERTLEDAARKSRLGQDVMVHEHSSQTSCGNTMHWYFANGEDKLNG